MYLPETPPLPPIKPGDPDYDPFAKPPPGATRAAIAHRPRCLDLPNVLHRPWDGRQTIQIKMSEMRAGSKGAFP